MSKRAEEKAMDAWAIYEYREHPKDLYYTCFVDGYKEGYELAEKDTIERVVEWLQGHSNDYIFRDVYMGKEELKISSQMFEDLKKAMEDEE